jgi:hypothetical protein
MCSTSAIADPCRPVSPFQPRVHRRAAVLRYRFRAGCGTALIDLLSIRAGHGSRARRLLVAGLHYQPAPLASLRAHRSLSVHPYCRRTTRTSVGGGGGSVTSVGKYATPVIASNVPQR